MTFTTTQTFTQVLHLWMIPMLNWDPRSGDKDKCVLNVGSFNNVAQLWVNLTQHQDSFS